MKLLKVADNFSRSMNWVLDFEVVTDHWSYAFVILGEDSLEDTEIILRHFESDLIKNVDEFCVRWILAHIECWWLQTLGNHVVSVQNFLRKNDQNRINFLVIKEPNIFQFENFTHQEVFESLVILVWILQEWNRIFVFVRDSLRKVGGAVVVQNLVPVVGIRFDDGDVVFLYDFDFDTNCFFGVEVAILWEMNTNNFCNSVLVFFITSQKVLDILVLGQWEFSIGQDRTIKFQSVHRLRFHFACLGFL